MAEDTSIEEFAEVAAEMLKGAYRSDLESLDMSSARLKEELTMHLQAYRNRLTRGYWVLLEELAKEKAPPTETSEMIRP